MNWRAGIRRRALLSASARQQTGRDHANAERDRERDERTLLDFLCQRAERVISRFERIVSIPQRIVAELRCFIAGGACAATKAVGDIAERGRNRVSDAIDCARRSS